MKDAVLHQPLTLARATGRIRSSPATPADYVPATEVRALLASSLTERQRRLAADDMVSTEEAAEIAQTTRVTVNAWIAKGRAIGLTQMKRGFRLPRWQFEPSIWEVLPRLSAALGTTEGWALLAFIESPSGALEGRSPRQALEQGQSDKVIELADHEGN